MIRSQPLRRRRRLNPRGKSKYANRPRDWGRMAFIRTLPCAVPEDERPFCNGSIQCAHLGQRGLGRKCSDDETAPLCRFHHIETVDNPGKGWYRDLSHEARWAWRLRVIAETQARWLALPQWRRDQWNKAREQEVA